MNRSVFQLVTYICVCVYIYIYIYSLLYIHVYGFSVSSLTVMQETWVRSLGWEDPLEKEMAIHSSVLAWRIPWTEGPGGQPTVYRSQESDMAE